MDYPLSGGGKFSMVGAQTSGTCSLTTLPVPSAINTKGAWGTLTASAPHSASEVWLYLRYPRSATNPWNPSFLADIAIGGGTSIVDNIYFGDALAGNSAADNMTAWCLPMSIGEGSPIYVRYQQARNVTPLSAGALLCRGNLVDNRAFSRCRTYGASLSTTNGTTVSSGSARVKGSWVQLTASTTAPTKAIIIAALNSNNTNTLGGTSEWLFDIGYGPAGSEKVAINDWLVTTNDNFRILFPAFGGNFYPIPTNIPAGSRLAVRSMPTSAGLISIDIVVYCFS